MKIPAFFCFLLLLFPLHSKAQTGSTGKVLVITDADADILVDGDKQGSTTAGNAFKLELSAGDHYIQAQTLQNGKTLNVGATVTVEVGKQKILNLSLANAVAEKDNSSNVSRADTVSIANVDFLIAGTITVAAWSNDNPDQNYPDYPKYYYVLDKGDVLLIDFRMTDAKKGTNIISVSGYADDNVLYSDNSLVEGKNLAIKIPARGIYKISFETNRLLDVNCNMRVKKVASTSTSKDLSPTVSWKTVTDTVFKTSSQNVLVSSTYKAVDVQQPMKQWVNSGSNAAFKGGASRVYIPVNLPENTVEWYYIVSADRDEAAINRTMSGFQLLSDVSKALDETGVLSFGIDLLTKPPGANYCDAILLDHDNLSPFLAKTDYRYITDGTRLNIVSGLVDIKSCTSGQWYIGLRNPDEYYGEYIAIEVVAVVKNDKYEVRQVKTPIKIITKKVPVMPS